MSDSKQKEILALCTFNTRGLGDTGKRRAVFRWLKKYHRGIILLQETHTNEKMLKNWSAEWKGQIFMCHGTSTSRGVAILISPEIDITVTDIETDNDGRFILLNTIFAGQSLIIVNIYAPTKDKQVLQSNYLTFVHEKLINHMDKHI